MKRHLFTIFSALWLLVLVAVCVLWVRGYWTHDSVVMLRPGAPTDGLPVVRAWGVAQSRGRCLVGSHLKEADMTAWTRVGPLYHLQLDDVEMPIWDSGFAADLGFEYNSWRDGWAVLFPTWFAALTAAATFAAFAAVVAATARPAATPPRQVPLLRLRPARDAKSVPGCGTVANAPSPPGYGPAAGNVDSHGSAGRWRNNLAETGPIIR